MITLAALILFMVFIIVYAQRDWYGALCGLVVFTAAREYKELPDPVAAKGVTHWSIMAAGVLLAWLLWRLRVRRPWGLPRAGVIVLSLYLLFEFIAVARLYFNLDQFKERASTVNYGYAYFTAGSLVIDCLYAPLRFMFIGLLLADGARTRRQLLLGMGAVLGAVLVYAIIINKEIPMGSVVSGGMEFRHRIQKWTGRHPNDLARALTAALWTCVALLWFKTGSWKLRVAVLTALPVLFFALLHTQSRGGWLAFLFTGLVTALVLRSGSILGLLCGSVAGVLVLAPSVVERAITGLEDEPAYVAEDVSAGRFVIWSAAREGIEQSPLWGYGMHGYVLSCAIEDSQNEGGGELHPHNAYLEALLDHGIVGVGARLGPFVYLLYTGLGLAVRRRDPLLRLAGVFGVCWAVTTLVMGTTGQHFGLTENLFTFWCAWGLVARAATLPDSAIVPARADKKAPGVRGTRRSLAYAR